MPGIQDERVNERREVSEKKVCVGFASVIEADNCIYLPEFLGESHEITCPGGRGDPSPSYLWLPSHKTLSRWVPQ